VCVPKLHLSELHTANHLGELS